MKEMKNTLAFAIVFLLFFIPSAFAKPFSQQQKEAILAERGFFLHPVGSATLFDLYRSDGHSLITSDLLFHAWHRTFDASVRIAEDTVIYDEIRTLSKRMVEASQSQSKQTSNQQAIELANANIVFFSVAATLLDPKFAPPKGFEKQVADEVRLIREANGLGQSKLMNRFAKENAAVDCTLFKPRGHYTRSERLQRLFMTYMWYARIPFYISKDEGPILQAFLLVQALYSDKETLQMYRRLDRFYSFLAGKADDTTADDLQKILVETFGNIGTPNGVLGQEKETLLKKARSLPMPKVDSETKIGDHRVFTFLGQRLSLDELLIDEVVDPKVFSRWLPSGLDVAYALGSDKAGELPVDIKPFGVYVDPTKGRKKARALADSWDEKKYHESMAAYWISAIRGLYHRPQGQVKKFIEHPDWDIKMVQTGLGAWTEMRHDLIAFIKPHYLMLGTTLPQNEPIWWSYVEPYPNAYKEISGACKHFEKILLDYGVSREAALKGIRTLGKDAAKFEELALKELAGTPLTVEEYDWMRFWPIENRWLADPPEGFDYLFTKTDRRMALIADVAYAQGDAGPALALEEAIGDPALIIARAEFNGKKYDLHGGVYTHYEFINETGNMITDEQWQVMQGITPRPSYVKRIFQDEEKPQKDMWKPLTVGEAFGGFYDYQDPVIMPDESVIMPVYARNAGMPDFWAYYKHLAAVSWNNSQFFLIDIGKFVPLAFMRTFYAVFGCRQMKEQMKEWMPLVRKTLGFLARHGLIHPRYENIPGDEYLFSPRDQYDYYGIVPKYSGVFVWKKGRHKPEKLIDVVSRDIAISPDGTKIAFTTGPLVPSLGAQGDYPVATKLLVADLHTAKILDEYSFRRYPEEDSHYDSRVDLSWNGDSEIFIKRGGRSDDENYDLKIDLKKKKVRKAGERKVELNNYRNAKYFSQKLNAGIFISKNRIGKKDYRKWNRLGAGEKITSELGVPNGLGVSRPRWADWRRLPYGEKNQLSPDSTTLVLALSKQQNRSRYYLFSLKDMKAIPILDSQSDSKYYQFLTWSDDHDCLFAEYLKHEDGSALSSSLVHVDGQTGVARRLCPYNVKKSMLIYPLDHSASMWLGAICNGVCKYALQQKPFFNPKDLNQYPIIKDALWFDAPLDPFDKSNTIDLAEIERKENELKKKKEKEKIIPDFPGVKDQPKGEWPIGKQVNLREKLPNSARFFSSDIRFSKDGKHFYFPYYQFRKIIFPPIRGFFDMLESRKRNHEKVGLLTYLENYMHYVIESMEIIANPWDGFSFYRIYPPKSGLIECDLPMEECRYVNGLYGPPIITEKDSRMLAVEYRPIFMFGNAYSNSERFLPVNIVSLDGKMEKTADIAKLKMAKYEMYPTSNFYQVNDGYIVSRTYVKMNADDSEEIRLPYKSDLKKYFGENPCKAFGGNGDNQFPFVIDLRSQPAMKKLPATMGSDSLVCLPDDEWIRIINRHKDRKDVHLEVTGTQMEKNEFRWIDKERGSYVPSWTLSPDGLKIIVREKCLNSHNERENQLSLIDVKTGKSEKILSRILCEPKILVWLKNPDVVICLVYEKKDDETQRRLLAIDIENRKHFYLPIFESLDFDVVAKSSTDEKYIVLDYEKRRSQGIRNNKRIVLLRLPESVSDLVVKQEVPENMTVQYLPKAWAN